jgi:hypothetical protein
MIFLVLFCLALLFGTVVAISMLYIPPEIENPVDADVTRKPEHKMTWVDSARYYARELRAPENAMRRRACLLLSLGVLGSVSLVLHFWDGAEAAADRALRGGGANATVSPS